MKKYIKVEKLHLFYQGKTNNFIYNKNIILYEQEDY